MSQDIPLEALRCKTKATDWSSCVKWKSDSIVCRGNGGLLFHWSGSLESLDFGRQSLDCRHRPCVLLEENREIPLCHLIGAVPWLVRCATIRLGFYLLRQGPLHILWPAAVIAVTQVPSSASGEKSTHRTHIQFPTMATKSPEASENHLHFFLKNHRP
ncbi:hypothetical protein OUZ56_017646 [Daphnia magna]|uniref:Uncharacterized protein n=1 Tax=Daphnia magna TaxID=35525 RepID=A0ABR0ATD3_9CRUS|nr:hypothetical protein OUZ56_017646 [Daphnia magna]